MMNKELIVQIELARKLLIEITDGAFAEHRASVDTLMSCIFGIGTALEREPALAGSAPLSSLLKEAESRLDALLLRLPLYVMRTSNMLASNWEYDEWDTVCRRRSAIAFLRKLLSLPDTEQLLDTEEVDELIRQRGDTEGVLPESAIDPDIPYSHWWWWYPNKPPTN